MFRWSEDACGRILESTSSSTSPAGGKCRPKKMSENDGKMLGFQQANVGLKRGTAKN